jgi:hypothetical protein
MPLTEAQGLIQLAINLGFAATMCVFIFVAYQKLVNRLADIIEGNTKAMANLRAVIVALCQRWDSAGRPGAAADPAIPDGRRWYDEPGGE